ncbi:uncharacterized protein LOC123322399 isoform X1 [Coccinella septempunctata]|uniref:uncharacterized protein LOC123322399 isoform X1 n=2 Tax=Coccinella septempunctata TaxID=41139 RepID=UPI001D05D86E|nr:uncharacterized protein LOC123322399 isoform X1 [Coccinella septempunctata]
MVRMMSALSFPLLYTAFFGFIIHGTLSANGLKWVRVSIPQFRMPGESAVLHCDYDLGGDALYAVKWYKEHEEFYRYVPRANPAATSYKVEGVHVDLSKSDSMKVTLHSVGWKTSGLFRCEVSAEKPSFASAQSEARMEVVSLPQEDPVITGVEPQYQIGDEINLNCTSGRSYPESILHWYINEQQVVTPASLVRYPHTHHKHGLISVTLGLKFTLSNRHFLGGSMRVKCTASMSPELWRGDRESVVQSMPVKDMREALLLVKSSSSNIFYPTIILIISLCAIVFWNGD